MALGLILGIGRAFRRKRTSSLDILSSKRAPRDYYKGKNCKPTGFHTRKEFLYGAYIGWPSEYELHKAQKCCHPYTGTVHFLKLNLKSQLGILSLKPYVSQCPREVKTNEATEAAQSDTANALIDDSKLLTQVPEIYDNLISDLIDSIVVGDDMVCPHLKLKPRQSEITFTSHILDLLFSLRNFPSAFMSHPSLTLFVNFVSIGIMHLLQSKIVEWRLRYGLFMVTLTKSNKTLENESMEIGDNKTHPILGPDSCLNLLKR
ncbi:hypothetical protein CK203_078596 [Vitis vinifera]|uniref:Uncharacterized protein n=1 Tax=Vitis vinifera TaxID=29760 RepID=A0A438C3H3_VITVI|nr:hypothetical protein CK203_078596 [Vitis vinifera]